MVLKRDPSGASNLFRTVREKTIDRWDHVLDLECAHHSHRLRSLLELIQLF